MEKQNLDLHIHSLASDGAHSVHQLIQMAKEVDLQTISITDHDTSLAYRDFPYELLKQKNLNLVSGIELSARSHRGSLHILGYGVDHSAKAMQTLLEIKKDRTIYSLLAVILAIKKQFNVSIPKDEIDLLLQKEGNVGRCHVAEVLLKLGIVSTVQEAFDKYLKAAKRLTKNYFPETTSKECITAILESGGIPVLAHPKTLAMSNFELTSYLEELISEGLMGMEILHSSYNSSESLYYTDLADKYNLITSGGSDFHGHITKPLTDLKTGKNGNLNIKSTDITLLNYLSKDENNVLYYKR